MKNIHKSPTLLFLIYWLFVGFPLGLFTLLMGPTRWVIALSDRFDWSEPIQNLLQKAVIILFIVVSFLLALWLKKKHANYISNNVRWSIFSALGLLFLFTVFMFSFHPEELIAVADNGESIVFGKGHQVEFVFGAYPDEAKLEKLKSRGYTAVVTLMSELVIPAEPKLIEEEQETANRIGIKLIHIPMLPFVSGNEDAVKAIQQLARTGKGKYYVHCYLGRDRVNVFKHIVENRGAGTKVEVKVQAPRRIEEIKSFERGKNYKLQNDIYLTPLPTEEEFFGYVVGGQFKTVVSLLNPANADEKILIDKESGMLKQYDLKFINIPLSDEASDTQVIEVLDSILKLPRPILIHAFHSNSQVNMRLLKFGGCK